MSSLPQTPTRKLQMDWSIIIFKQLCLFCRVQASMVLIWEMSFWTQLALYRWSVRVKHIISFFFWIEKKKSVFLVSGFFLVGIYISVLTLETCKVHWQDSQTRRRPVLLVALTACFKFNLFFTDSILVFFVCISHICSLFLYIFSLI